MYRACDLGYHDRRHCHSLVDLALLYHSHCPSCMGTISTRVAVLVLLAACTDPFTPAGAVRFDPPTYFADLWRSVEACSGQNGDWRRIEWFTALPTSLDDHPGYWVSPHHIYLTENWPGNDWLISHEMLHDLLQRGDHPQQFDSCNLRVYTPPMGDPRLSHHHRFPGTAVSK